MIERIEQLLINKRYFEAIPLLRQELKASFDFSEENQRLAFTRLKELSEQIEHEIGEEVGREINIEEKMRSVQSSPRRPRVDYKDLITKISLSEALSQVIIKKSLNSFTDDYDAHICILDSRNIPEELSVECSYPEHAMLSPLKTGDYFTTKTKSDRECFSVIGYPDSSESDPTTIVKGLKEIIDSIYEAKLERIGVAFTFSESEQNTEIRKVYFYLILITFLLKIIQNAQETIQPNFYFSFQQEPSKDLFEKTAHRLNKTEKDVPKVISVSREDRLRGLITNCLTKDPGYIDQLRSVINVIDEDDTNILLLGESGVGKSFLANNIHKLSFRNSNKFEEQNCGNLAGIYIIQKLWGWKKGAFTDARFDLEGKVHKAEGGTLFLDEIDRTTVESRNEMLTFIEKKQYQVGGEKETLDADVRLIFGSNKDFGGLIKKGLFEEDFYYRMSERIIRIPPLRDRIEDIDLIISYTLNQLNSSDKGRLISIDKKGREYLKTYSWPGNVRELARYIKQRYKDAFAEGQDNITLEQMKEAPFENFSAVRVDDYENLIEILRKLMTDWNGENGMFLDEIIKPILSKIFVEDCFKHIKKTEKWKASMDFLGISGLNLNTSNLQKFYDKFPDVKSKLGL
jgi:DNA-binding NtrC family response regulator